MTTDGVCPGCGRSVRVEDGRYRNHSVVEKSRTECFMSRQRPPVKGTRPDDYEQRAETVAYLAHQVQDEDPAVVWNVLTATPADELQRLLVLALAAIDTAQTVDEMFAWVSELPAARLRSA